MKRNAAFRAALALLVLTLAASVPLAAQDLASFEAKTKVHVLPNGWTFIIVERPAAPVFSFATVADVGSAQEVPGITGLAHMFEHMAFKGTPNLGTSNYEGERKALDALEAAYQAYQGARLAPHPVDSQMAQKVQSLLADFKAKQQAAASFVLKGAFDDVLSREGGVGTNASTSADETRYFYSLPANKIELFAYLESERFFHPVFREFYEERDVVMEERRMSTESQPIGRLVEQFTLAAFAAHPYHQPTIGYASDLESITMTDAERFFNTWYVPSALTTAIVGDVHAETLIPLLDKYFGRIPARPAPPPLRTVEPQQVAEKTVVLDDPSQPMYLEAYHRPASTHPDQAIYDAIDDILSTGRTSRLYRALVRDKKLAVEVESFSGYPGEKYPNLWAILAVPAFGVTNQQVQAALREELEKLKTQDPTDEEMARFKTRSKANLIRSLANNQGLANQLAEYQRLFGDWRELFHAIDKLDKVTKADIRRVASETFRGENRTVAMLVNKTADAQPPAAKSGH
ncbi:MAG: pitrilysin family protein [Thermoanaerobaculia bacterium]